MRRLLVSLGLFLGLTAGAAPPEAPGKADDPPKIPPVAKRTTGLSRREGLFPFYWDARRGQLLLEITRFGEDFLYGSGLAGGVGIPEVFLDRGQPGELGLCRFSRVGPRVLLTERQTAQRSGVPDRERTRVVEESFPSSILASLPVAAETGGTVLVDATAFLLTDTSIAAVLKEAKLGEWKQDPARSAVSLERSGAFPRNTEIEADLTFACDAPPAAVRAVLPDGRTMSLRVHHTFLGLPPAGYRPRPHDPRIGFIPLTFQDHTAPFTEPLERGLIQRWRLEKKDPSVPLSEPVAPIVYYLDRGIPEPERTAIREAALWWNHAFEEAGLKNALVLRDLPEGATFLDARYSGVEWINRSERAWSVGEIRVDPRTGEILHAVARIDSHRRRTTSRMWRNAELPASRRACLAADGPDPGLAEETLVLQRLAYLSAHEVGHTLGLDHNWAATTFGWGSVMDYLAPNIQLEEDGTLDLSNAYPKNIGSYDRLAIRWGYGPETDPDALDKIVRAGYARGIVYPLESDARWAEYDFGPEPAAWLAVTQKVRGVLLERFGADQLRPGEPVHDLTVRFSLAYLYHRFGIQAAQQAIGGQYLTNALAGDGQVPAMPVPAARQREALGLLAAALSPENLEIPERVLSVLVPAPSGTRETRERFPFEAGATFSPLAAARSLSDLIVGPLMAPEKAARLTSVSGEGAVTLDGLLRRLVDATWGTSPAAEAPTRGRVRRVAQRVVLDRLMDLAADGASVPEVRAVALLRLEGLRKDIRTLRPDDTEAEAHVLLALRDLQEFLDDPDVRKNRPARAPAPPGRPIGGE
jgi:Met-zincin/Domain of unknown function (DUF5117)